MAASAPSPSPRVGFRATVLREVPRTLWTVMLVVLVMQFWSSSS
jgi:UDP-N-acetylglucosamine 2-epimerase